MKAFTITPSLLGLLGLLDLVALPGCPSSGDSNPGKLWLANDRVETQVKLVDVEPHPF